jgi:hypothetical protein
LSIHRIRAPASTSNSASKEPLILRWTSGRPINELSTTRIACLFVKKHLRCGKLISFPYFPGVKSGGWAGQADVNPSLVFGLETLSHIHSFIHPQIPPTRNSSWGNNCRRWGYQAHAIDVDDRQPGSKATFTEVPPI